MSGIQHITPLITHHDATVPVIRISTHLPADVARLQTAEYLSVDVTHKNGTLTRIIFATVEEIFLVQLHKTAKPNLCQKFRDLLGGSVTLVGFEMAKSVLMLQNHFKTPVQGVDLSECSINLKRPSAFVREKVTDLRHGQEFKINKLWYNNSSEEDACHRAWISARWGCCLDVLWIAVYSFIARVALEFRSEICYTQKVNTRHLKPKVTT